MKAPRAIFEIGLNHMGDVKRAIRMVDMLYAQGSTHITIQAVINFSTTMRDEVAARAAQSNCLSLQEVVEVIKHGTSLGAVMGVAVVDPEHVVAFVGAGAKFFKVLSSDITYTPLSLAVARTGLPCYLSTGLATTEDIARAIETIRAHVPEADIRLIHTVLKIPTPAEMLNLNNIRFLHEKFSILVAYGQHSDIREALIVATAIGAETVFVYVAEEHSPQLPDGPHAVLCSEAGEILQELSQTQIMAGSTERVLNAEEQVRRIYLRRSVVATVPIKKGEKISLENIAFKRPGTGRSAWDLAKILGSIADKDYQVNDDI